MNVVWDCLIVGGGPAGLTAATYLGRFHRSVRVVDAGDSRARAIPESHNHPGFSGISGPALLDALRKQAQRYGAQLTHGKISSLVRDGDVFVATSSDAPIRAARVLLATGITDFSPELPGLDHAVAHAAVRYCPVCDGFEATDLKIAVYGSIKDAQSKATFLRTYTSDIMVLPTELETDPEALRKLQADGIAVAPSPADAFWETESGVGVALRNGQRLQFDVLYPALGCVAHSDLAAALGARVNNVGCIEVDDKQRTCVEGLYAAGDVVSDLHQLSVAEGHAAIAATAIHNSLPPNFR